MLRSESAVHARDVAMEELSSGKYDGANFVCVDADSGWTVHGGDEIDAVEMHEGLNIIANGDLNEAACST